MANLPAGWFDRARRWHEQLVTAFVAVGIVVLPLIFFPGQPDVFRLPKTIAFRAEAILIAAVTLMAIALGARLPRITWRDRWVAIPLATIGLTALLTALSTNRLVSIDALVSTVATAVVFFATLFVAPRRGWFLLALPLGAAVINTLLVIVEELDLWMPFGTQPGLKHHLQCSALLGNPNEIGSYLGAAALACVAGALVMRSMKLGAIASLLIVGLIVSQTLTALIAFAAALFMLFAMTSVRAALKAAVITAIVAIVIVMSVAPLRTRVTNMLLWARSGNYNAVVTERLTPFLAAWEMFTDHPIAGVGPGAFGWQYYDYKLRVEAHLPELRNAFNRGVNFGEVHNDHLQLLAEGGVIGYLCFLALLTALASIWFEPPRATRDARAEFARRLAMPLVVFVFVLSIAQFPIETTVVRSLIVHLAALCVGWRNA